MTSQEINQYRRQMTCAFARHYEKLDDVWSEDQAMREAAQALSPRLPPHAHILDIGAGRGRDSAMFLRRGFRVTAIDPIRHPDWDGICREYGERVRFVEGFFPKNLREKFNGVLDNGSFHHQHPESYTAYLQEIYDHLLPGGTLLMTVYTPTDPQAIGKRVILKDGRYGEAFTAPQLEKLVASVGFESIHTRRILQENGRHYYLEGIFRRPLRLLLVAPLPTLVKAATQIGFQVTTVWPDICEDTLLGRLLPELRAKSHRFITGDFSTFEGRRALRDQILRDGPIEEATFIGPDDYADFAWKLLEEMGFSIPSKSSGAIFRSKSRMRQCLDNVGLSPVKAVGFRDKEGFRAAVHGIGLPVIVKPDAGGNSRDIHEISTQEQMERFQANLVCGVDQIAEERLEGMQVSVETVSYNGSHSLIGVTEKYPVNPPHFVEMGGIFPARISEQKRDEAFALVKKFLDAAEFQFGAAHTEVFLTPDGPKIVESHPRPGGLIPFLIAGATNFSIEGWLMAALKDKKAPEISLNPGVALLEIISFEPGRTLIRVDGLEDVRQHPAVVQFNIWAREGVPLRHPTHNLERHGYMVVKGSDEKSARHSLQEVLQLLKPIYKDQMA